VIIDKNASHGSTGGEARTTLPTRVREVLEHQILTGALREGDQIVEYQLARQLGISQTPVREALRTLERDGLLITRPHRGTFVRRVGRREAAERYSLGMELEAFAARRVMPRLTEADFRALEGIVDEMAAAAIGRAAGTASSPGAEAYAHSVEMNVAFHRYLVERAGHDLLLKSWLAVNPLNWRFVTYTRLVGPDPVVLAERHRSLLGAYRSGDQVLAAAAIRQHIWEVAELVLPNIPEEEATAASLSSITAKNAAATAKRTNEGAANTCARSPSPSKASANEPAQRFSTCQIAGGITA